jgi:hypothetical protein
MEEEITFMNNMKKLDNFLLLESNWNLNGAEKFSKNLIDLTKTVINSISIQPEIFPTGRNSIQLEWEKDNGDYLEFEVFQNEIICLEIIEKVEKSFAVKAENVNSIVRNFYGKQ